MLAVVSEKLIAAVPLPTTTAAAAAEAVVLLSYMPSHENQLAEKAAIRTLMVTVVIQLRAEYDQQMTQ